MRSCGTSSSTNDRRLSRRILGADSGTLRGVRPLCRGGTVRVCLLEPLIERAIKDGPVIDLGCGSGILSGVMFEAGYDVLGIDISKAMIATRAAGGRILRGYGSLRFGILGGHVGTLAWPERPPSGLARTSHLGYKVWPSHVTEPRRMGFSAPWPGMALAANSQRLAHGTWSRSRFSEGACDAL